MSEGRVGLEFPLDRDTGGGSGGGSTIPGDAASSSTKEILIDDGDLTAVPGAANVAPSLPGADETDAGKPSGGGAGEGKSAGQGGGATAGLQLRSEAPGSTILLRARRKMPVVGSSGHRIMAVSTKLPSPPGGGPTSPAPGATTTPGGEARSAATQGGDDGGPPPTTMPPGQPRTLADNNGHQRESGAAGLEPSAEAAAAARGETRDVVVHVYWDGSARDRAHVEVFPANRECGGSADDAGGGGEGPGPPPLSLLRLGVRVPTLAVVDAQAAVKFAERVVQQIAVQVDDEKARGAGGKGGGGVGGQQQQQQRQWGQRLRLAGVDAKSVDAGNYM